MAVAGGDLDSKIIAVARMATAIVRGYTFGGFVIAADGRESIADTRQVITDYKQKIHQIVPYPLSYCMRGYTLLGHWAGRGLDSGVLFNFNKEVSNALSSLASAGFGGIGEYARALADAVHLRLKDISGKQAIDFGGVRGFAQPQPIVTLLLDGYWQGIPERVNVVFSQSNGQPLKPRVFNEPVEGSEPDFSGSQKIFNRCFPDGLAVGLCLSDLVCMAREYIQKCCDSNEDDCWGIGGRIHIATITPEEGFRWITGYEPIAI